MITLVVVSLLAYFIGNISPSTILAKKEGLNIKDEGSGNAGTTNALRVLGKKAGAVTFVIDILKGVVAVLIGMALAGDIGADCCALLVYLGHVWPILYKLKGGKGVATAFGATLAVSPAVALIALGIVAVFLLITKRMSAASIIGAASLPVLAFFIKPSYFIIALVLAILMIIKHSANIKRLLKGEEPIMDLFKKKGQEEKDS